MDGCRHAELRHAQAAARPLRLERQAPIGLFSRHLWHADEAALRESRGTMRESDVHRVALVFEIVEVVAIAAIGRCLAHALGFEIAIAREGRCLALAEIGEDQAEIFARRVGTDADGAAETLAL